MCSTSAYDPKRAGPGAGVSTHEQARGGYSRARHLGALWPYLEAQVAGAQVLMELEASP